jgi:general secretion pathway protein J
MTARMPSRVARGFTLLEVMLAIVLLALLLAGTWGAIRTTVHAMHSGEDAIDRTNRLRVAEEFMRHQISRILPLAFGQDDSTGTNYVFEGSSTSMRFVAPMPGYLSKGGPYVQTLKLVGSRGGGKELVFTDAMLNGFDLAEAKATMEPAVLLDQIQDAKFQYRTLDDQGDLTDWSDQWDDPSVTPVMVRIFIAMRPEARVVAPDMEIPLMLDVGASHAMGRPGSMLNPRGMGGLRRRPLGGGP